MTKPKNAVIHSNFTVVEKKGKSVCLFECKYCFKRFTAASSTRLQDHLSICNRSSRLEVIVLEEPQNSTASSPAVPSIQSPSSDISLILPKRNVISSRETIPSISTTSSIGGQASPFTLNTTSMRAFADSMNAQQLDAASNALARWIFADNIPFNVVESNYFQEFIQCLRPVFSTHLPSRHRISHQMLDDHYSVVKNKVEVFIKAADCMCLITDGWSNVRGDAIINFVLTSPKPIFFKSIVASGFAYTGKIIVDQLCDVIELVSPQKLCGIVTDNAKNMKAAWVFVQERYPHIFCLGCTRHSLHLLCKDLINKVEWIHNVLKKCEKVVEYFGNHHRPKFELEGQQIKQNGKTLSLTRYSPTRWGTVYDMFHSVNGSKGAIVAVTGFVSDNVVRGNILEDCFWDKIELLEMVFKPIVAHIKTYEKDTPQLSDVYSNLYKLRDHFNGLAIEMRDEVMSHFEKRWNFIVNDTVLLAHFLNPQQRGEKLSEIQFSGLRMFIKGKFPQDFPTLWSQILHYKARTGCFACNDLWEDAQLVDPITWWKCHGNSAPHLQNLAAQVMNLPASSAASERCWSAMGNIHNDIRNRLSDDKVEKLTYIYFNERMLQG